MVGHLGIPGLAPFIALGLFFAGIGAAVGAYSLIRSAAGAGLRPPEMGRVGCVGELSSSRLNGAAPAERAIAPRRSRALQRTGGAGAFTRFLPVGRFTQTPRSRRDQPGNGRGEAR